MLKTVTKKLESRYTGVNLERLHNYLARLMGYTAEKIIISSTFKSI